MKHPVGLCFGDASTGEVLEAKQSKEQLDRIFVRVVMNEGISSSRSGTFLFLVLEGRIEAEINLSARQRMSDGETRLAPGVAPDCLSEEMAETSKDGQPQVSQVLEATRHRCAPAPRRGRNPGRHAGTRRSLAENGSVST